MIEFYDRGKFKTVERGQKNTKTFSPRKKLHIILIDFKVTEMYRLQVPQKMV
jgi:hypothetical protein